MIMTKFGRIRLNPITKTMFIIRIILTLHGMYLVMIICLIVSTKPISKIIIIILIPSYLIIINIKHSTLIIPNHLKKVILILIFTFFITLFLTNSLILHILFMNKNKIPVIKFFLIRLLFSIILF